MQFKLQQQIKQNASEIREYLSDLYEWEESTEQVQPQKENTNLPPVRGAVETNAIPSLKRDGTSIKEYYDAWNKFDVDDYLEDKIAIFNKNGNSKPNSQIVVRGGRNLDKSPIIILKEQANELFKQNQYQDAISQYQKCIDSLKDKASISSDELEQLVIVHSNKAQCHLKLHEYSIAVSECTQALKYNQNHLKSLLRRSTALQSLGRLKESLSDCQKMNQLDPLDEEITKNINKLKSKIESKRTQARANLRQTKQIEDFIIVKVQDVETIEKENKLDQLDD